MGPRLTFTDHPDGRGEDLTRSRSYRVPEGPPHGRGEDPSSPLTSNSVREKGHRTFASYGTTSPSAE